MRVGPFPDLGTRHVAAIVLLVGAVALAAPAGAIDHGNSTPACDQAASNPDGVVADERGKHHVTVELTAIQPFDPPVLTIDSGTCVTFVNDDDITHTVHIGASTDGDVRSEIGVLGPGESVDHTFGTTGFYYLHCEFNAFHELAMHQAIQVV